VIQQISLLVFPLTNSPVSRVEMTSPPVATQATSSGASAQAAAAPTTVAEETTADGDTHIAALVGAPRVHTTSMSALNLT
jgi:hypothetical protein